jgi:hypothetical protein
MTAAPDPVAATAYLDQVRATIRDHGWIIQGVIDDETGGGYAYTVGLTPHQHPELLIRGLPLPRAHSILNQLGWRVVIQGQRLDPDDLILYQPAGEQAATDPGLNLTVDPVPTTDLGVARALYGHDVQAYQVRPHDPHPDDGP